MKNIFIKVDDDLHAKVFAKVEKDKQNGKLSDAENVSSIIRGLLRKWLKGTS
jgi:hypothetical protein